MPAPSLSPDGLPAEGAPPPRSLRAVPSRAGLFAFAAVAASVLLPPVHADDGVRSFLAKYCLDCHDADSKKGERQFDDLALPIADEAGILAVQEIVDQLNLGEMPPRKADQPAEEERAAAIAALTAEVGEARSRIAGSGGQTVLRRLNEREYLNSLEDLLGRRLDTLAPTAKFPAEQTDGHIDTIGDALVTSGFLLDNYLEAAHLVVEKALAAVEQPEERTWRFRGDFTQGQELSYSHRKVYNFRYLCVYEVPNTVNHEGGYAGLEKFPEGVHADGLYEVRVLAHAMHRDTPYDPDIFGMDFSEPFRLGIVSGDARIGELHHPQPVEPQLAEVVVEDGEPRWYTMEAWLETGQQPRFIFPNGMANCRGAFSRIAKQYSDQWPEDDPYTSGIVEARRIVLQHGQMPHIRIHEVRIRGPIHQTWPPEPQRRAFGEDGFHEDRLREILAEFASRAFRRPLEDGEIDPFVDLAAARVAAGHTPRQSALDAIKAVLCAPSFLYLSEAAEERGGLLAPHDLAARLAYFLTASPPDDELRARADSGEILQNGILLAEAERLLDSPRSDFFLEGFLDSWLNLRAIGETPPDRKLAVEYFHQDLGHAMKEEAKRFLRHLLDENRPLAELLDCDYTFVNKPLAQLYGLPHEFAPGEAAAFRKVSLPDRRRGGLLGMGAVLTVSANGIETSPVVRGVYLLENILGTPPPPPPDEVPAIEPDIRGATTIREQLAKHRELATCAECHRRIDPPGFALENFDPIGRWRDRYPDAKGRPSGPKIDASGEMSDGSAFRDASEFKTILLGRKELFARHLAGSLLSYGTGRRLETADRPVLDEIAAAALAEDGGARTLLLGLIASEPFRSR